MSKDKLKEIKKQAEEYLNGWKRARADLVNFQKETEKQKETWIKFANSNFISTLLPFCDNFEEALKYVDDEGMRQLKKQFDGLLKEFGVERMEVVGEKFNPEFHESVESQACPCEGGESGIIIKEIQIGYKLHEKILRPSKVVISK
ncbi:MAG: nucleotide exchange factor GrpE [Patescibacteria group bacterium]|nr:nucleotide exchange factor GrpE [Patescibacteria group bacterium]